MPNTLHVSKTLKVVEYIVYILLLCFILPVKKYSDDLEFENYLDKFNKTYNNVEIYQRRYEAFKKSLDGIDQLNKNRTNSSALYGLTKYSDISIQDFLNNHLLPFLSNYRKTFENKIPNLNETYLKEFNVPKKVDWREKNAVTKVRTQGNCGACWAIAGVEIIESINAIKTGKLDTYSVQEMIDCAKNNDGCSGGDLFLLFQWLKTENVTIVTEEEYPTTLFDGTCKQTTSSGILIKNYHCGNFIKSEELIIDVLAHYGPVAVAINALSWQNYVSGIIQFHCDSSQLNHAVEIVGYDLTAEIPYYIIKNSWGEDFGDHGYLNIAIGGNVCGLAEEVCIVEL